MISRQNYLSKIKHIDLSNLHKDVLVAKDFFDEITDNGTNYELADSDSQVLESVELYFDALNKHLTAKSESTPKASLKKTKAKTKAKTKVKAKKKQTLRKPIAKQAKASVPKSTKQTQRTTPKRLPPRPKPNVSRAAKVELVDLELKFIARYVNLHGRVKSPNQIRLFLSSLQKAIVERRIRKTSKYAKQILKIQDDLILIFDQLKGDSAVINLDAKRLENYSKLIGKQIERESTKLIKSYVSLQGRHVENRRAENLLTRIKRALKSRKILSTDKYFAQIDRIRVQLKAFIDKNINGGVLTIASKELSGLNGIVGYAPTQELKNTVMRSTDFLDMKFEKLNFQGKWLEFIGNPSPGFSTMIFGMPKTGKSYLMVEFAGYLARNHGSVLYVAKEEELDDTLQEKLRDTEVTHPELYVSDYLPQDLSSYDFVFLDSVTKLRLKPDDLVRLGKRYPNISFVYVFQATKNGAFRGSNEFQHDVDVVIEVPYKGFATQYGRFNQGGEMRIFND